MKHDPQTQYERTVAFVFLMAMLFLLLANLPVPR